jgi:uncharacterized membrane protein YhaH (DUF805 family)
MTFNPIQYALFVLRLVFWPQGRIARLPFLIYLVVSYAALFVFIILAEDKSHAPWVYNVSNMLSLLIFWPKFAAAGKRLHDINLSGLLALPYLVFAIMGLYDDFGMAVFHFPDIFFYVYLPFHVFGKPMTFGFAAIMVCVVFIVLCDLILFFIPGNRDINTFGPPPGRQPTPAQDVF